MSWELYDYINYKGINEIKDWATGLEKKHLGKLNSKLDDLVQYGTDLPPNLLSESGKPHIKKMRFHGDLAMRPLLCEGPTRDDNQQYNKEFTLLCGVIEKDRRLDPADALDKAYSRRQEVINDPNSRRCIHEPVEK